MDYTIGIKTVNFGSNGNATEYVDIETSAVNDYFELSGEAYTGSGSVEGYVLSKQAVADSNYDGDYYAVIIDGNDELNGLYSNFEIDTPYDWIDVDTSTNPVKIFVYNNDTDEERDGYVKFIHKASEYCYAILYIVQEADTRTISVSDDTFIVDRFSENNNEINVTVGGGNKKYYVKSINKYKASGRQVKYDNAIILSVDNDNISEDDNGNYIYPVNIKTYGDINTECYYYKIILVHANKRSVTATITLMFGSSSCDSTDSVYTIPDIPKYGSMVILNLTNITAEIDNTTVSGIYYVDYNGSIEIVLTADSGYNLPSSVTFSYTSSNVQTNYSGTNGIITITNIDCAVTVAAVAVADTVTITFDLSALYAVLEDEDDSCEYKTYEVEKGTTVTFYLKREDSCHSLPDSISVTLTDSDSSDSEDSSTVSYSYIKSSGKTVLNKVSENITILAKGVVKEMPIEFVLTNITTDYDGDAYNCNEEIAFTLYASDGYKLPDSITVAIGSSTYSITSDSNTEDSDSDYEFNYDKNTGDVVIGGAYKNVVITAVAEEVPSYTVTVNSTYCTADITRQEVSYGDSIAITFTEEDGYALSESGITINGTYNSSNYEGNVLTIISVQSDIVITAVAEEEEEEGDYYFESSVYYLKASYDSILIGINGISDALSNQDETTIANSSSDSIYAYWIFTSTVSINLYGYKTEDEYNDALEIVMNTSNSDNTGLGLVSNYVVGGNDIEYTAKTTMQLTDSYDATKFGWYIAIVSFTTVDDDSATYYIITINSSNCEIIVTSTEAVVEDSITVEEGGSVTFTVIPNDGYEFTRCVALTDSDLGTVSTDTTTSSFELDYNTDDNTITISDIYCDITLTVTCSVITHTITLDLTNCTELNNATSFTVYDGDLVEFYVETNSSKYDLPSTIKVTDVTKTYSLSEDAYTWDSSKGYFYMSNITSDYVVIIEATT